ncbi:DUF4105 domain-containing protein [Winogradskyella sp. UBA3174]|uniref:lipoprotein N-acyltransferase Lnb domain-containing protein n=1 Tax=Winogradskyella sp. UBA3174 TaxID=1947785 RepID=UPI0025DC1CF9|nr:DUF4105 domain-containing protein [Winogradskyella sp. UBA3174]|tara:strand:- start:82217 stop:83395 length:1179 start_codon:yes stop_codon:yes gene_type:complete
MRLKLLVLLTLFFNLKSFAQQLQLSPSAEVSILTLGSGESLNDAFGHNAFRINDRTLGADIVFGYGEYDFEAPNFYLKFAQGKLNYLISKNGYNEFKNHYIRNNRTITEQVLNFSPEEKQKLLDYLVNNYKPENRRYLYDFFYDNCATRIRDVTATVSNNKIAFNLPKDFKPKTFRQLIHEHVGLNTWGSFGIDIALGSVIDIEASASQHMFLPKYITVFMGNAKVNGTDNIVKESSVIFEKKENKSSLNFILSPLVIVGLISIFILFITYKDYKKNVRSKWLDITLFLITGLTGILLLLLWFATDHTATGYNYNLLWAFPLNIFIISQLFKNTVKIWFKGYLKLLVIMLCLMTLHWFIGVQVFSIVLIPLIIAIAIRYSYIIKFFNKNNLT